jgi:formylglycine-generating enzyme required for sulfatase activity
MALVLLCLGALFAWPQSMERRAALVIGNGAYTGLSKLNNPVNDASDMAAALRSLGFDVELLTDASLPAMEQGVLRLGSKLSGSSDAVGFFFYAGHGVQSGGINYLIPADAQIAGEAFLKTKALAVQALLDVLQGSGNKLNVIVLDACRDNPFSWGRSGNRGLSVVGQQPPGSIIAYATGAGNVAQDGTGRNGVFTAELLRNLRAPGTEIQEVFRRTGAGVQAASGGAQTPAVYSQFFGQYYLAGAAVAANAPTPPTSATGGAMTVETGSGTLRVEVKSTGRVYVDGVDKGELPAGGTGNIAGVAAGGRTVEVRYADGQRESRAITVEKDRTASASFVYVPEKPVAAVAATTPEMVLVEGGTFQMWDTAVGGTSDEWPVHSVTLSSFYVGKYEVTQKEWVAVMGSNPSSFKGDDNPVESVSWLDAVDFCNRLSAKEGLQPCYTISGTSVSCDFSKNGYRLPTEAEWEYAAKGGGSSRGYTYAGGNDAGSVAWYDDNSGRTTHAVGGKQANELGLYDMSGNVWEWCWDWHGGYSGGSQTDPRGPSSGSERRLRGGSWGASGPLLRLDSFLKRSLPGTPNGDVGFRVARAGTSSQVLQEMPKVTGDLIFIDGGTFQMGSTSGEADERPVHSVTASSFYLGKYEVTQKQWIAVMSSNPSNFKGDNLPVEQVSWYDAVDFCNRLSAKEGLQPCYTISGTTVSCDFSRNGYRLPTEAEWEYAARGGRSSRGYTYAGGSDAGAVGWYSGNSGSTTHAVGGKQANELGLYDMSGNVWEWCWDWYGSYGSGAQTDPRGPSSGQYRLLRGGSWSSSLDAILRASSRLWAGPGSRFLNFSGFRVARSRA